MTYGVSTQWGLGTLPPDSWLHNAACTPETAELFWPVSGDALDQATLTALAICRQCPVIAACGQWAIDHAVTEGIWGGMRPNELRRHAFGKAGIQQPAERKSHCPRGHEYTAANIYVHTDGKRRCRKCKAARAKELKAELNAARPGWRANVERSECWRGHPFDDANTYVDSLGRRLCRACRVQAQLRFQARKKAALS